MRFRRWMLVSSLAILATVQALAQAPLPELKFDDPPGFYRSAIYPPADYSSQEVNASLQVYPFRPFTGDVQLAFSRTLLRELVDTRSQEMNVAPGRSSTRSRCRGRASFSAHDSSRLSPASLTSECAWRSSPATRSRSSTRRRSA